MSEKLELTALIEAEIPFTENDLTELKIHNWRLIVVKTIHYGLSKILQETKPLPGRQPKHVVLLSTRKTSRALGERKEASPPKLLGRKVWINVQLLPHPLWHIWCAFKWWLVAPVPPTPTPTPTYRHPDRLNLSRVCQNAAPQSVPKELWIPIRTHLILGLLSGGFWSLQALKTISGLDPTKANRRLH